MPYGDYETGESAVKGFKWVVGLLFAFFIAAVVWNSMHLPPARHDNYRVRVIDHTGKTVLEQRGDGCYLDKDGARLYVKGERVLTAQGPFDGYVVCEVQR